MYKHLQTDKKRIQTKVNRLLFSTLPIFAPLSSIPLGLPQRTLGGTEQSRGKIKLFIHLILYYHVTIKEPCTTDRKLGNGPRS